MFPSALLLILITGIVMAQSEAPPARTPGGEKTVLPSPKLITSEQFIEVLKFKGPADEYEKHKLRTLAGEKSPPARVTVNVLFKVGSTELADDFSVLQMQEAGEALSSDLLAGYRFEIAGHSDNVGTVENNLHLSQERAEAVKQFLIKFYGVTTGRLEARGYGESEPVASNETEEGRAKNRRVVFSRIDAPIGLPK